MTDNTSLKLRNGSRIAIVGGGPSGSFFGLFLLKYAAEEGLKIDISIYQQKDFNQRGAKGCKGCAGILSMSLQKNLEELDLSIPEELIQNRIKNYAVDSPYASISISNPDREGEILSVYRGGGPREYGFEELVSFDGWLLDEAEKQGVRVINQTVSRITLEADRAVVRAGGENFDYDLAVLATGVNAKTVTVQGADYTPPRTQPMIQNEVFAGAEQVKNRLEDTAHAFLLPKFGVILGTLVPKGPFINVSILNARSRSTRVYDFLHQETVSSVLPDEYKQACNCRSRVAVSAASGYYADRFVAVGDAAVTRLYKDGIGSSLLTARRAAFTSITYGISGRDFRKHYRPFCRSIEADNRWGKLLFKLNDIIKESRLSLLAHSRIIGAEQNNRSGRQPYTRTVWGMFTGSYNYKSMAMMVLNPISIGRYLFAYLRVSVTDLFNRQPKELKRLHVGTQKVLILGSGFGGTYALRKLVRSLNRNENIETTMVSNENFFLFTPLLHEVAMGRIETRHIAYPIRRLQWRDRFNFIQAETKKIDIKARKVETSQGTLDFDYLVMALGSVADTSSLKSVTDNVFTLKTLRDSMLIRNHIISQFEAASVEKDTDIQKRLLTFVISGAGYTGIQVITELRSFIFHHLLRFYKTVDPSLIRIILVEVEPKIVADMHTKLGAYIMDHLKKEGIEVRLKSQITRFWNTGVEINRVENVPTGTVLWVSGVKVNPVIGAVDLEKDPSGRVIVNEYMEVTGHHGIYAIGDCAHFTGPSGRAVPPRAHIAVRQAKVAAHNILAAIRGTDKKPYRYIDSMEIVSLGGYKAVFRFYRLRMYGLLARIIWLVSYTLLITGKYNRTRIIVDWLSSTIFGRDTTFIRLNKKEPDA